MQLENQLIITIGIKSENLQILLEKIDELKDMVIFSQIARPLENVRKYELQPTVQRFLENPHKDEVTLISKNNKDSRVIEKLKDPNACHEDCKSLSKMELRAKYAQEANTHRNMLSRKKLGAIIHPSFLKFDSFLRHIGPAPAPKATLDRINNMDPEYAPGKVRWADKRTQNNNKSDTLIFYYSRTGETYTTSKLAKLQKVSPSTIRKRLERRWSDDEIIEGKRNPATLTDERKFDCQKSSDKNSYKTKPFGSSRKSAKHKSQFEILAEDYKTSRKETGEEAFPLSYQDAVEAFKEFAPSKEIHRKHIINAWPKHKPHVNYDNIDISLQEIIAEVDPDYVRDWNIKKAELASLRKLI